MKGLGHKVKAGLLGVIGCAIAGCAGVAPQAPSPLIALDADDRFAAAQPDAPAPGPADLRWWRRFDDPLLAAWVERALANAPDIAIARERVAQAQAVLDSAHARRGPSLDAQAGANYDRRPPRNQSRARLSAGVAFDWDADLWGGLRQAERSAAASLLRSEDLVQATRLTIAGLAARGVIEYRQAVRDSELLAQAHALQGEVLRVVRVRVDVGLSPRLDLERAVADLAAIEADQAAAAARARQAFAALQLVAGERPQPPSLHAVAVPEQKELQRTATLPALDGVQPVGRPLDLLRRRPDLRAAERALEAAVADIGVAQAALRPRLHLPGTITLATGSLGVGALDVATAGIAALIEQAVYDGGRRQADVAAAESRARELALVYRQTLLQALGQVEAALVGAQGAEARIEALVRSVRAADDAAEDARILYTTGLSSFLDVLDARRTALATQRQLAQARADAARAAVAAFEALGLVDEADTEARAPAPASTDDSASIPRTGRT